MPVILDNPFQKIIDAAVKICPEIDCFVQFDPRLECPPYGETCFADDGKVIVSIAGDITVEQALEILAHELAHVIVGETAKHGKKWKKAFDNIFKQYTEDCKRI